MKDIAVVFDCGATNVRVIAMNTKGEILASSTAPNEIDDDPGFPNGKIWDLEKLWSKLCIAAHVVASEIDVDNVAGVTVTTFGVDGGFVDSKGELLYPVISWQCERTNAIMESIDKYMPVEKLYEISGVYPYTFNTINKMVWFRENHPEVIDKAHRFLFIPSLLIHKLSGDMENDSTMMGTSMMADLNGRLFSNEILSKVGIDASVFGEIREPGERVGGVHAEASQQTGLNQDTPVFIAGHDTQFAVFGSGAKQNEPVLSSGTWEILMARSNAFKAGTKELENKITTEFDAQFGLFNIGQNWLGSGVLEWFATHFYSELSGNELYQAMIGDAEKVKDHNLIVDAAFYTDGIHKGGEIKGLTIGTTRGEIYRAFLESLAERLSESLKALEKAGGFKTEKIICVGGGSKNRLWNQLRANACQVPIQLINQKETTVLGAALFVFAGAGLFQSVEEARNNIDYKPQLVVPLDSNEME